MTDNTNTTNSATETISDSEGNVMQTYERANKLTVKLDPTTGRLQADFFRTHKHIATIHDNETGFQPEANCTKSAEREAFRKFVADHAADMGITYDPEDRRTEANLRKATYATEAEVTEDAIAMVTPDIRTFVGKMPHADLIVGWSISVEAMRPKTKTSKGTDLALMGIEDGRYLSNNNMAWFDIDGTVTMTTTSGTEIYQQIPMELVSGQLKKFRMTQTQWNTDTTQSLIEAGLVEAKADKADKTDPEPKPEEPKPEEPKPTKTRKSRKSAKTEDVKA